jgi:transcriptional regulator with GAF, ATPase, and Fis domain
VDGVRVFAAPLSDGAVLSLGRTKVRFALTSDHNEVALSDRDRFGLLVGGSPAMREVYAMLEAVSASETTVLLLGETGTGKDVAAHSIHQESDRRDGPLLVVDCGAIPAELLESELFGHERGAFTGADLARPGAFEAASGGTLFLDEIGELSLELQPKLLRVLESRETKRVGGNEIIPVDVRLVAATNRNLRQEVNARRFRSDLYFRLAVVEIELPPLREHKEDLPALVAELLANMGVPDDRVEALQTNKFLEELTHHTWPGNGRELRNYLERCAALKRQLPLTGESPTARNFAQAGPPIEYEQPWRQARREWIEHFERRYLDELLRRHGNNVTAAARAAGVDRVHFHRLLSRNGLR